METVNFFKALGDPIRMEMLTRLSSHDHCTIGRLSDGLPITRQGARKHIKVLSDAQVICLKQNGREVDITLNISTLKKANQWILHLEKQWDTRLIALKNYVEKSRI